MVGLNGATSLVFNLLNFIKAYENGRFFYNIGTNLV